MQKRFLTRLLAAVLAAASVLNSGAYAATITVTNVNDSGPGSLREAIEQASNGDEIVFDASLASVPIVLTGGQLVVGKNLRITGLGPENTIVDGDARNAVFVIREGTTVTISQITIQNAKDDGVPDERVAGIVSDGVLALDHCVIRNNIGKDEAGGIDSTGTLTISACKIVDNFSREAVAGISSGGSLSITGSLIAGNYTLESCGGLISGGLTVIEDSEFRQNEGLLVGAIFNAGVMRVTNCLISSNYGRNVAGGILNTGELTFERSVLTQNGNGGGLQNGENGNATILDSLIAGNFGPETGGGVRSDGMLVIKNTTISENGGGAVVRTGGSAILINSTVTGNHYLPYGDYRVGGIFGTITLRNSIVAGNYDDLYGPITPSDCLGSIASEGNNLIGNADNCSGVTDGLHGDIVGVDPGIVLESGSADNGGSTPTVALIPGSPAIDHIPEGECVDHEGSPITTDQRGVPRPQGAGCDVGAFEFSLPRGAGFWAHQCSDKGFRQVSATEMEALFAKTADNSSVFPECAPINCDFLMPQAPKNDMRARAQQLLLDVWLNLNSGRLTRGRPVDLAELTTATTVGEALSELELTVCDLLATHSDLVNAKDIAEALNGSTEDMELTAVESSMALLPGASRTMVLGLINLSPGSRNYTLSVSGPWSVRLSTARISALGSGEVAQITATITAPLNAQDTDGQFRVTASDLATQGTLKRGVTIKVRSTSASTFQPVQKPAKVD